MPRPLPPSKVALISPAWTTWQHRLMSGALRYADAHPRIVVRGFGPVKDLAAAGRELTAWGADGILGHLDHDDLEQLLAVLRPVPPLVNTALASEHPGVVTLIGDFSAFVETAVNHLRQLGVRSLAIFVPEEGPHVHVNLVGAFLRIARPADTTNVSLVYPADRTVLWNPEAPVTPVPAPVADWLHALPRPVGILCPHLGGGGYLIRCCQALGLRVPEDVAIVGGDDTDLSLASNPTCTSVLLATESVGFEAMRLLAEWLAGAPPPASPIRLRCADLQVRESTGLRRPEICDIAGALQCIHENACRGITVEQVIRQTQRVSKVTFHRRFQESIGKSPAEAIRGRKLDEARRLLRSTELPLGMISDLCGFSSSKVFARSFREAEQVSPRDYRKQQPATHAPAPRRGAFRTGSTS